MIAEIIANRNKLPKSAQSRMIDHQLQFNKATFKIVQNELALIQALMLVFASSGSMPSTNDILFLNEVTPRNYIENFIMRAFLFE